MTLFDFYVFLVYLIILVAVLSFLSEALSPFIILSGNSFIHTFGKFLVALIPLVNVIALTIAVSAVIT